MLTLGHSWRKSQTQVNSLFYKILFPPKPHNRKSKTNQASTKSNAERQRNAGNSTRYGAKPKKRSTPQPHRASDRRQRPKRNRPPHPPRHPRPKAPDA